MAPTPRIVVTYDLPATPAVEQLWALDYAGKLEVVEVSLVAEKLGLLRAEVGKARGIICRPTRHGRITDDVIEQASAPFFIATMSRGTDHIIVTPRDGFKLIAARGEANAPAVAELTTMLAMLLLRPVHLAIEAVGVGRMDNSPFERSQRLQGMWWTCLGSGAQVRHLLPMLCAMGIRGVTVYHPEMDTGRLRAATEGLLSVRTPDRPSVLDGGEQMPLLSIDLGEGKFEASGTRKLEEALSRGDIVSIHLPLQKDATPTRPATYMMMNASSLAKMKDQAFLINVSRGDIVDESAVLSVLMEGALSGYAADVVNQDAEATWDPTRSPLWSAFLEQQAAAAHDSIAYMRSANRLNIVLTPHLGGTTWDALESITAEVIGVILDRMEFR